MTYGGTTYAGTTYGGTSTSGVQGVAQATDVDTATVDGAVDALTGTITLDGSPVAGADVFATRASDFTTVANTQTDSDGVYYLDVRADVSDGEKVFISVEFEDAPDDPFGRLVSINYTP